MTGSTIYVTPFYSKSKDYCRVAEEPELMNKLVGYTYECKTTRRTYAGRGT